MLPVVADDQLAAGAHTVTLAAPVPVHEVGEQVTRGRLLSHASQWPTGLTLWGPTGESGREAYLTRTGRPQQWRPPYSPDM